jgi:hypothetical protein
MNKAVLDYTKDPVVRPGKPYDPKQPYCERCGKEIKDLSKAVKVTFNCDTFEVYLGHDVATGYPNKRVVGNTLLGSDCAKRIGLLTPNHRNRQKVH